MRVVHVHVQTAGVSCRRLSTIDSTPALAISRRHRRRLALCVLVTLHPPSPPHRTALVPMYPFFIHRYTALTGGQALRWKSMSCEQMCGGASIQPTPRFCSDFGGCINQSISGHALHVLTRRLYLPFPADSYTFIVKHRHFD